MDDKSHVHGGEWTTQKLAILGQYLSSYGVALSKQAFKKGYIDAFAGTGWRESTASVKRDSARRERDRLQPTLPDMAAEDPAVRKFLDGSARVALQCKPPFDSYVFIEKNLARCKQLELLKEDLPEMAERISVRRGDANEQIQQMCRTSWTRHRAVLFLDPYGAQVKWNTIEAIAKTKAIDLWILFPLSGVNRMLTKSGEIPAGWEACLNDLLGTAEWRQRFYRTEAKPTLFGGSEQVVKVSMQVIAEFFLTRLKTCFTAVAENPVVLRNSKNSPLFLLCFAAGNPKGAPIALEIASHILKMGS